MAIEKKTTKKTVKKTVVKKAAVAAKPAAAKKAPAKAAVAKKTAVSQERFNAMVSEAAYFASQNDGNRKGSAEYWVEAEAAVRAKFDVA